MKQLAIALIVTLFALPMNAAQRSGDFENIEPPSRSIGGVPLGSAVIFSWTGAQGFVERSDYAPFGNQSLSPIFTNNPLPYILNFYDRPITSFALDFGDADTDTDTLTIRAYSDYHGRGNLIAEAVDILPGNAEFTVKRLKVEASGIRSIVFIGGSAEKPNSVFYDNFRVSTEPRRASFNEQFFGYADFAVYRPQAGALYSVRFAGDPVYKHFSLGAGKPVTGDFDGDNLSDAASFNNGIWSIQRSSAPVHIVIGFGQEGDIPVSADFDADGKTDIAVFRPAGGYWYVLRSSDGQFAAAQFGQAGDIPVPANYDADGKMDFAVFRPETGSWYILGSRDGFRAVQFGISTDKPVPADYDGDGITDIGVFRDGYWYLLRSKEGFHAEAFGQAGDIPAPNDYFTDFPLNYSTGKDDIAVFRPESGTWFIRTASGFYARQWGQAGDIPISLAP